jgi:23S rRNA (pseudouridine1915-N3)-methyltransferase
MIIKIIQVGKTKTPWVRHGEEEFLKKLKPYVKIKSIILEPENKGEVQMIVSKETEKIIKALRSTEFVCLLSSRGKEINSKQFAEIINGWQTDFGGNLTFIIGGSWGVGNELYERADYCLSLSKMTMLHEVVRIFFLEQVYRAIMINRKKPYHKGKE